MSTSEHFTCLYIAKNRYTKEVTQVAEKVLFIKNYVDSDKKVTDEEYFDADDFDKVISNMVGICGHASRAQETFTWISPAETSTWSDQRVLQLFSRSGTTTCRISGIESDVCPHGRLRIETSHPSLSRQLALIDCFMRSEADLEDKFV